MAALKQIQYYLRKFTLTGLRNYDLMAQNAFITKENINDLISTVGITGEIGLLNIDIDVNDFGFIISSLTPDGIQNSIEEIKGLNNEELKRESLLCASYIERNNSLESFSKGIGDHLQTILQKHDL